MVSASKYFSQLLTKLRCICWPVLPFLVNGSFSSFSASSVHPFLDHQHFSFPRETISEGSYIDARNAQNVQIEPVLLRRRVLQHVPVRQLRNVAIPFRQVSGVAM